MVALILASLLGEAHAAECVAPVAHPALTREVHAAMDAFYALDADTFRAARARVLVAAPCLDEPVQRRVMAELHRVEALHAFLERDEAASKAHFAAAALIEPDFDARELAPEGHPILAIEAASRAELTAPAAALSVGDGLAWWDGGRPPSRVGELPGLLQTADRFGVVREAEWVEAGGAPALEAQAAASRVRIAIAAGTSRVLGHQVFAGLSGQGGALGIGWVREKGGIGGYASLNLQNGVSWSQQPGWTQHGSGDTAFVGVGAQKWWSVPVGALELAPQLRAGVVYARSGVDPDFFATEIVANAWGGSTDYMRPRELGAAVGGGLRIAKAQPLGPVRMVVAPEAEVVWAGDPMVMVRLGAGFEHDF